MLYQIKNLVKKYKLAGQKDFTALKNINLEFDYGEMVAIVGESGSGKSTLMNLIGGLDSNYEGEILFDGKDLKSFTKRELTIYHKKDIGFIFQDFSLIPHLSVIENVMIPMTLSKAPRRVKHAKAKELLAKVGLSGQENKLPNQLSGGQKQRVAIARALINDPKVIIADEPTGALDAETTNQVLDIIKEIALEGRLVLMVTHSSRVADFCSRIVRIDDGHILSDNINDNFKSAEIDNKTAIKIKPMGFWQAFRLALLNVKAKFSRNLLVIIGSSIGIMSIILMLSFGRGVKDYINSTMKDYSNPLVTEVHKQTKTPQDVMSGDEDDRKNQNQAKQTEMILGTSKENNFSDRDIKKLSEIKNVTKAQAGYSAFAFGTTTLQYNKLKVPLMQYSTVSDSINKSSIKEGHLPTNNDQLVLDNGTATSLLPKKAKVKDILNKKIKMTIVLDSKPYEKDFIVSGIYESPTQGGSSSIAYTTLPALKEIYQKADQKFEPNVVYLTAKNADDTDNIKEATKKMGYTGSVQESMTEMFNKMLDTLTFVLAAIAGISLLVSAIMILVVLNISVVERTKEIGVLKALGASAHDISNIFVSESFLIGLFSGIFAVGIEMLLGLIFNHFSQSMFDLKIVQTTPTYIIFGLIISIVISMLAGFIPAKRASRLDPVDSLRQ